jgi:hypothetical protein
MLILAQARLMIIAVRSLVRYYGIHDYSEFEENNEEYRNRENILEMFGL